MDKSDAITIIVEHDYQKMLEREKLECVKWSWYLYRRRGVVFSETLITHLQSHIPENVSKYDPLYEELILTSLKLRYIIFDNDYIANKFHQYTDQRVDITCRADEKRRIYNISSLIAALIISFCLTVLFYIYKLHLEQNERITFSMASFKEAMEQLSLYMWFTFKLFISVLPFSPTMVFFWIVVYMVTRHSNFHSKFYKPLVLTCILLFGYGVCYICGDARYG